MIGEVEDGFTALCLESVVEPLHDIHHRLPGLGGAATERRHGDEGHTSQIIRIRFLQ